MINLFNVALIGSVLLGVAHGASVATAGSRYFRCTVEDGFQAAKCLSVRFFLKLFTNFTFSVSSTFKKKFKSTIWLTKVI